MTDPEAKRQAAVFSPAKINLYLEVTGRRPDGYHTLVSLMCPISLGDTIRLIFDTPDIRAQCAHPLVPEDHTNLARRAADLFFNHFNHQTSGSAIPFPSGVHIKIDKYIPVAAGLGGGSSNAAAVLTALNRHHGEPFTLDRLMKLGGKLGADVPFFLLNKPAIATGVGDILTPFPMHNPLSVLLVNPGIAVSAKSVYHRYKMRLTKQTETHYTKSFREVGDERFDPKKNLRNDLEIVTAGMYSEISEIKKIFRELGAIGTLMSGSGPTVFGLFENDKIAEKKAALFPLKAGWKIYRSTLTV